ncbi:MAG: HEPN domain-containing protein [Chthoniobacterales bacterium]|nr:HEPN domain-containing protein [Chthoniobacterales bacterium]
MNGNPESARAWLQKAGSDLAAADICLAVDKALDAACFHCQQAAEKAVAFRAPEAIHQMVVEHWPAV